MIPSRPLGLMAAGVSLALHAALGAVLLGRAVPFRASLSDVRLTVSVATGAVWKADPVDAPTREVAPAVQEAGSEATETFGDGAPVSLAQPGEAERATAAAAAPIAAAPALTGAATPTVDSTTQAQAAADIAPNPAPATVAPLARQLAPTPEATPAVSPGQIPASLPEAAVASVREPPTAALSAAEATLRPAKLIREASASPELAALAPGPAPVEGATTAALAATENAATPATAAPLARQLAPTPEAAPPAPSGQIPASLPETAVASVRETPTAALPAAEASLRPAELIREASASSVPAALAAGPAPVEGATTAALPVNQNVQAPATAAPLARQLAPTPEAAPPAPSGQILASLPEAAAAIVREPPTAALPAAVAPEARPTSASQAPPVLDASATPIAPARPREIAAVEPAGDAARIRDFVRAYDGGPCFFAAVTKTDGPDIRIDSFSNAIEPVMGFHSAFMGAMGIEPDVTGQRVWKAQCPAVEFLRETQGRGPALALDLDRRDLRSGEVMSGTIRGAAGRPVTLLLVSETGAVEDLSASLTDRGADKTFAAPLRHEGAGGPFPQMLVAVADSGRRLEQPIGTVPLDRILAALAEPTASVPTGVSAAGKAVFLRGN